MKSRSNLERVLYTNYITNRAFNPRQGLFTYHRHLQGLKGIINSARVKSHRIWELGFNNRGLRRV